MNDYVTCRICRTGDAAVQVASFDGFAVACPRCGHYSIDGSSAAVWENKALTDRQIANAAGWIREHQRCHIGATELKMMERLSQPSLGERAAKVLVEVARRGPQLGAVHTFQFSQPRVAAEWMGISWSTDAREVAYLFEAFLMGQGLINAQVPLSVSQPHAVTFINVQITPQGHAKLEEFRATNRDSQIGFCAMWFDQALEPLWLECIEPAIAQAGYEPKRIDGHQHNNKIDDEIVAMIRQSRFVVADFTGQRGGVYFEAGFAMGLGLEVIWTCRKDEIEENKVHFDNRQYNFVTWEPDKFDDFQKRLHFRIEATLGKGPRTPPVR